MRGWFQQGILLVLVAGIAGCEEFFSEKPTVLESRFIINDINRVSQNPYTRKPLPDISQIKQNPAPLPEHIIVSEGWLSHQKPNYGQLSYALLKNELGYVRQCEFHKKYLWPCRNIMAIAGWPYSSEGIISPDIFIMKKKSKE